jgi:hypothetical protein
VQSWIHRYFHAHTYSEADHEHQAVVHQLEPCRHRTDTLSSERGRLRIGVGPTIEEQIKLESCDLKTGGTYKKRFTPSETSEKTLYMQVDF